MIWYINYRCLFRLNQMSWVQIQSWECNNVKYLYSAKYTQFTLKKIIDVCSIQSVMIKTSYAPSAKKISL